MNNKKTLFVILSLSLISLFPLWQWLGIGIPKTHDLLLQIARIASFSQGLREGNIFPRWGGNLNWGYGHPSLMFLYPLTSYIGGLLSLAGLSFTAATKLTFMLTAVGGTIGMYLFLRRIFSSRAAVFGTFLYLLAPYRLVDINVRGALGELMGLAVIPWVFWRFFELMIKPSRKNTGWAALSIFFLILAHNAVGLMGLGMLGIWLTMMLLFSRHSERSRGIQAAGNGGRSISLRWIPRLVVSLLARDDIIVSLVLGFGLAAFYWIPGIIEGKYTFQKEFTNFEIYAGRFPAPKELLFSPWGYGPTPESGRPSGFTVSMGWAAVLAATLVIPALSWNLYKDRFRVKPAVTGRIQAIRVVTSVSFLVIFLFAIFFLTPLSLETVKYLGIIQRFQFPWRWLAMTVIAAAILAAATIEAAGKRWIFLAGLLGLVAAWQAWSGFFIQGYEELNPANETFSGSVAWTTDTGESTPRWTTRFQDKYPKSQLEVVWGADIDYLVLERKQERHRFLIEAKIPTQVVDNTLYFPGWKVTVNGQEVPIEYQDQNWRGLITFPVPAGRSEAEVEFTMTGVRKAAAAITLVSFAMLGVLIKHENMKT